MGCAVGTVGPLKDGAALLEAAERVGSSARWFVFGVSWLWQHWTRTMVTVLGEYQWSKGAVGHAWLGRITSTSHGMLTSDLLITGPMSLVVTLF